MDKQFYLDLRSAAQQDLSAAHLKQHFKIAQEIVFAANISVTGLGTWSSLKTKDTVEFANNTVTGKKHWVSGITDCQWLTFVAKENHVNVIVLVQINVGTVELVPTVGMEGTVTGHVVFNQAPAIKIMMRDDPRMFAIDADTDLSFITVHLGLVESLFRDIDNFTSADHEYTKKKLRLDIEVLRKLWEYEIDAPTGSNDKEFWDHRRILYAFGKKTLLSVTQFVTEATGSGLYELTSQANQRYKDSLIYSTHMRNLGMCFKNLFE